MKWWGRQLSIWMFELTCQSKNVLEQLKDLLQMFLSKRIDINEDSD